VLVLVESDRGGEGRGGEGREGNKGIKTQRMPHGGGLGRGGSGCWHCSM
jgi:hypothetical protein